MINFFWDFYLNLSTWKLFETYPKDAPEATILLHFPKISPGLQPSHTLSHSSLRNSQVCPPRQLGFWIRHFSRFFLDMSRRSKNILSRVSANIRVYIVIDTRTLQIKNIHSVVTEVAGTANLFSGNYGYDRKLCSLRIQSNVLANSGMHFFFFTNYSN